MFMSVMMGIDVSHYQATIDWKACSKHCFQYGGRFYPNQFVIMKAMYESRNHQIDEQFENNYNGANRYDIAQGVYIYHASKSLADPEFEATRLVQILKGRKLPYGIWHDLEDKTVQDKSKINELVGIEDVILRKAGYNTIGIYCNLSWYNNVIDTGRFLAFNYPFWIARYPKNDDGTIRNSLSPYKIAGAWQYSSKGKVVGIKGNVDLNIDFDGLLPSGSQSLTDNKGGIEVRLDTLRNGSRGTQVQSVQSILKGKFNLDIEIDGIYGAETTKAIKKVQRLSGLSQDGVCGIQTWNTLLN
jgi:GH25 family lysozyme M1 (1,4-beta-N-acetylmuramidase)